MNTDTKGARKGISANLGGSCVKKGLIPGNVGEKRSRNEGVAVSGLKKKGRSEGKEEQVLWAEIPVPTGGTIDVD